MSTLENSGPEKEQAAEQDTAPQTTDTSSETTSDLSELRGPVRPASIRQDLLSTHEGAAIDQVLQARQESKKAQGAAARAKEGIDQRIKSNLEGYFAKPDIEVLTRSLEGALPLDEVEIHDGHISLKPSELESKEEQETDDTPKRERERMYRVRIVLDKDGLYTEFKEKSSLLNPTASFQKPVVVKGAAPAAVKLIRGYVERVLENKYQNDEAIEKGEAQKVIQSLCDSKIKEALPGQYGTALAGSDQFFA